MKKKKVVLRNDEAKFKKVLERILTLTDQEEYTEEYTTEAWYDEVIKIVKDALHVPCSKCGK